MKVLASDFDGTLYFEDGFHQKDIQAIKEFQKQGHLFGLCSGRPYKGAKDMSKEYIDFDFYITTSGALIIDKDEHVLFEECIPFDTMCQIHKKYEKDCEVYIQADGVIYCLEQVTHISKRQVSIHSLEELKDAHIHGLSICAYTDENAKRKCDEITDLFEELDAFQNKDFIDIVKKGCSKGKAIAKLRKLWSLDCIAGIGDSYNDIPMLEEVDHSFTFFDSPISVQEKADTLVTSVSEAISLFISK